MDTNNVLFNSFNIFKNNKFELNKINYNNQVFYCVQDVLQSIKYNSDTAEIIKYLQDFNLENDIEYLEQRMNSLNLNNEEFCSRRVYINKRVLIELINSVN